ncbi:MAG TPA: hypothetical protein VMJ70_12295 [Candidatus Sulfotelmatobacter sp.]|nr:hypothetical protein [Candidatus Sulfotelmatobacter sp.]
MQISKNSIAQELTRDAAEVDALLRHELDRARDALATGIDGAGDRLGDIEAGTTRRVRVAARRTERYVRKHPWQVASIGIALAVAVGVAIGLAAASRKE